MMADEFWTKVPLRAGTADELAEHRGHLGLIEAPQAAIWLASVMKTITHDYGYLASLEKTSRCGETASRSRCTPTASLNI
jgi:DNA transposition AAA+ family ATPase